MKKTALVLIMLLAAIVAASAATKTPPEYQAIEKQLKKEYKKVIFADKFFIVQDKKTKNLGAATLDGFRFSDMTVSEWRGESAFELVRFGEREFLKVEEYPLRILYTLSGKKCLEGFNSLTEFTVGQNIFVLKDKTLYDLDFRKVLEWTDGKLEAVKIGNKDFLEIKNSTINSSGYSIVRNKLYDLNGTPLKLDYSSRETINHEGQELIVFTDENKVKTACYYNPVGRSLSAVFVDNLNPTVTFAGKKYYYVGLYLYNSKGKLAFGKPVTEIGPDYLIVKDSPDGKNYGAVDVNIKEITPAKWQYLKVQESGKYRWFLATKLSYNNNSYSGKHPEEFVNHVVDFSGREYSFERAPQGAKVEVRGGRLAMVHGRNVYPARGASLKDFAYVPTGTKNTNATPGGAPAVAKTVSKEFPSLEIVEGSVRFVDPSGRNAINAEGAYALEFSVRNTGKGLAQGCKPVVTMNRSVAGVSVGSVANLTIAPGATTKVSVPVNSSMNLAEGSVEFSVQVDEPNGFGTEKSLLAVSCHAFEAPRVIVNDYTVTAQGDATLQKKKPFELQVLLQNVAHGRADDVAVTLHVPDNVYIIEGETSARIAKLDGGQTKELVYTLVANNNYTAEAIPLLVDVREKHGKYAESRQIDLKVNQALTASRIVVNEAPVAPKAEIELARLNSDVDVSIPTTGRKAENTFVVIVANENYTQVAQVPHAANDGRVFAEYCRNTLGVPERNIRTATNATLNEMKRNISWLGQVGEAFGDKANLIFYYSGHGVPDESTSQAYLLPVDGYHSDMGTNLAVSELYTTLNEAGAGRVTVFMDACFSGSRRGDGMLMAARGVQIKAKAEAPKGSMVVFSAAQGDETAYPYDSQRHGLFTYYLLKKLQESGGRVTLGELSDYLSDQVAKTSLLENSKLQTPQVQISPALSERWREMEL